MARRPSGLLVVALALAAACAGAADPLPSWSEGKAKQSIVDFVAQVTKEGSPGFVAPAERVVVFDSDGVLRCEQPMPVQTAFTLDRVRALAPQHPEWRDQEPFASVLRGDVQGALARGSGAVLELVMATQTGMTTDELDAMVKDWFATARHPVTGRPYTEMVYQPMLELLAYLRASGFKTFIASGGGTEFLRAWTESVFGIPPERVFGSREKTSLQLRDGRPQLVILPVVDFSDDKENKPIGIHNHVGRRPIAAFGNSDGDLPMLAWTCEAPGPRLCAFVHHTDAAREWAYDRESKIGRLDKGLDEARSKGWTVVDMKNDWKVIYPPADRAGNDARTR